MNKLQRLAVSFGVSTTLCLVCLAGVHAATHDRPNPYFGHEEGINVLQDFTFPYLTIGIEATGVASQVGRYDGQGIVVIDVTTGEVVLAQYVSTASNGDQLFADLQSTPLDEFTLLVEGNITGGSGRFDGATGQYLFLLRYDLPSAILPNSYNADFFGWIRR